jgi:hypothetical protein
VVEFRGRLSSGGVFAADPEDHRALPVLFDELKNQIGKEMEDITNMEFDLSPATLARSRLWAGF